MKNYTRTIVKVFFILFSLFGLNATLFAQWTKLNSGTTTSNLRSVFFTCIDTGYVVGDGIILKTTDGGDNWLSHSSDTTYNLNSVYFIDANHGYAVGDGIILKTLNGGNNWVATNVGFNTLKGVFFPDDTIGYMVGLADTSIIYKTTDGGKKWLNEPCLSNCTPYLASVFFTSRDTGYVAGEGGISKTTDGGANWIFQSIGDILSIYFPVPDTGYAVGYDVGGKSILKTTNGGANWTEQTSPTTYKTFFSVYFTSIDVGYAVGGNPISGYPGLILKTIDGGINWEEQPTNPINNLYNSVHFPVPDTGYVVGQGGTILKTTNGGIVGLKERSQKDIVKIYPNPAKHYLKIEFSKFNQDKYSVEIVNYLGEKLISQTIFNNREIVKVENLMEGIYFIKVYSNNGFYKVIKFVKED